MVYAPSQSLDYRRDTNPIRGLMYARLWQCLLTLSKSLLAASTAIEQWAISGRMQFGVAKCGIISFTGHLAPRLDNPLDIRLHGQLWSWAKPIMGLSWLVANKSHLAPTARQRSTRVSDCSLVPDSRLPLDPFWLKLGLGSLLTRSLVSRVRLLERS
ncbi:hypothetical protein BASA81_013125 [Batrachochytrium salamandrivorans]|nr:hypothetical protein BASA81_013125 [Batrachochytrium salamandrivorans]